MVEGGGWVGPPRAVFTKSSWCHVQKFLEPPERSCVFVDSSLVVSRMLSLSRPVVVPGYPGTGIFFSMVYNFSDRTYFQ